MLPARFIRKIIITEDGHWLWTGSNTGLGYGRIKVNGKLILTHRFAWEDRHGIIPEGLYVLHLNSCHTRACCNPDHCYLGTQKQNMQDRKELTGHPMSNKTECLAGHPYDYKDPKTGKRGCTICKKDQSKRSYLKTKGVA